MAASDINRSLVSELEAMGFSEARATKALHSSGMVILMVLDIFNTFASEVVYNC